MSAIAFQVIDLACEAADQSFFPPRVTMQTKSTTQIATVIGFDEYAPSTPPKRYKTLTWDGHSEQQLWFPTGTPGNPGAAYQIAGARFDYSGSSAIDSHGNYTSLYTKNLSKMCNATGSLYTCLVPGVVGGLDEYIFAGWLGPTGHEKCALPGIPYQSIGNQAVGEGQLARTDSSPFWGSKVVSPGRSNVQESNFLVVDATHANCNDVNSDINAHALISLFEPLPLGTNPGAIDGTTQGITWFFGALLWDHVYSATLSDEYTDAEALTNAQVILGNGATAQNRPRTTGFVSSFTNVVFTLLCTNLIVGKDYVLSVDLWDSVAGTTTTKQYGFSATQATKSIADIIPTPLPNHNITVQNPRIVFA